MPVRIVLADDHPILLEGVALLLGLEREFSVVARCTNGIEALAAVRSERPDVLVADVQMPGHNGLALLREITAASLPTRVVLLTARIERNDVLETIRAGVG